MRYAAFLFALFITTVGLGFLCKRVVFADGSGSGSAIAVVTVTASPPAAVSTTPADQLHDPTSDPVAAFDDLKAAKKLGWPALVFAIVLIAARVAAKLGKSVSFLAKLGTGRVAVYVAGAAAVAVAGYNAAALGGSAIAIAAAALMAAFALLDPEAPPKNEPA